VGFEAELEDGEEILFGEVYAPHKKVEPFALAVSNRAVYFAEKKRFAVRDSWQLRRFSHSQVRSVSMVRTRPYVWWLLSAVLIVVGLATSVWMIAGRGDPGATQAGYPFGVLAVGLVLPFVVRGRAVLKLETVGRTLQWRSPLTVDSGPRKKASAMQRSFVEACQKVGLVTNAFNS